MVKLAVGIMLVALATLIGSWGALFFKRCSGNGGSSFLNIFRKKELYLGSLLYGASAFVFVFALTFGELSVLYPVASLSYVWICLLSIFFLQEKMNDLKWFGIIMIMIGVVLIGFGA